MEGKSASMSRRESLCLSTTRSQRMLPSADRSPPPMAARMRRSRGSDAWRESTRSSAFLGGPDEKTVSTALSKTSRARTTTADRQDAEEEDEEPEAEGGDDEDDDDDDDGDDEEEEGEEAVRMDDG